MEGVHPLLGGLRFFKLFSTQLERKKCNLSKFLTEIQDEIRSAMNEFGNKTKDDIVNKVEEVCMCRTI